MKKDNSVDEILQYAIRSEQETADFYLRLSNKARNLKVRHVFEQYAREEFAHVVRLTRVRENGPVENRMIPVTDFNISDYTVDLKSSSDLTYTNDLVLAMRKSRATFRLFFDLASKTNDIETSNIFKALAQDEAKHKLGFETEYNESLLVSC